MFEQIFLETKPDSHACGKIIWGDFSILGTHFISLLLSFEHFWKTFEAFKSSLLLDEIFLDHFGKLILRELVVTVLIPFQGLKNREDSLEFIPSILYLIF